MKRPKIEFELKHEPAIFKVELALAVDGKRELQFAPNLFFSKNESAKQLCLSLDKLIVIRDCFVGLGGILFKPEFVSAKTPEEVLMAFNKLSSKIPSFEQAATYISAFSLLQVLTTGSCSFESAIPLSIPTLFHHLDSLKVRNMQSKLKEINAKVKRQYKPKDFTSER